MNFKKINAGFAVAPQIKVEDVAALKTQGYRAIISNRPDGEAADQPPFAAIAEAANAAGLKAVHVPVISGKITDADVATFEAAMAELPGPVLAYCGSGTRATTLWALSQAGKTSTDAIMAQAQEAGYDMTPHRGRIEQRQQSATPTPDATYDLVIVGAGSAGIATAASLLHRKADLKIAIIDPADTHYYQPGWTLVGGGVFSAEATKRAMEPLIPKGVIWIKAAVASFAPARNVVVLNDNRAIGYSRLVVCPGLRLDWDKIDGLTPTLGRHGVTSNYRYDLAPYTWQLVQGLKKGRAVFTQPPMPIKCAGAPQKAMYLSGDAWFRNGALPNVDIQFMNAGGALFGVKEYVPALMEYVQKYDATLNFFHNLIAVDGPGKTATFEVKAPETDVRQIDVTFDMLHVCPPQSAPDFIRNSPLADVAGWVDVDQTTLRHKSWDNIWSLGDVMNAPNAKTMAAARKQAPVVAENIAADIDGRAPVAAYNGYGSCPLTVARGKIVLAEFGYGGALAPSFPSWLIDGTKPSRLAWLLKEKALPPIYWNAMLKGREWLAHPDKINA